MTHFRFHLTPQAEAEAEGTTSPPPDNSFPPGGIDVSVIVVVSGHVDSANAEDFLVDIANMGLQPLLGDGNSSTNATALLAPGFNNITVRQIVETNVQVCVLWCDYQMPMTMTSITGTIADGLDFLLLFPDSPIHQFTNSLDSLRCDGQFRGHEQPIGPRRRTAGTRRGT